MLQLTEIARTEPQAAYSAFTHGTLSKWTYLIRTMSVPAETVKPLEEHLRCKFLPAITGRSSFTDTERKLLALPTRFGGLGVTIPADLAKQQFQACKSIIAPLSNQIFHQQYQYTADIQQRQRDAKREALSVKREKQSQIASEIHKSLPEKQKCSVDILKEKGASNWLNTLPILEHGFALSKGAFRDALCLRYGWQPFRLPSYCTCGKKFTIDHAMSCPCGGLPTRPDCKSDNWGLLMCRN